MPFYPPKIHEKFCSPAHAAREGRGSRGIAASFACGSFVEFFVVMDGDEIAGASFRTNGCGFMVAAADVVCGWLHGRQLSELHGLDDDELRVVVHANLEEFPADRTQCASVVFDALHKAMANYRSARISEYEGEKALICTCFGVSEDTIVMSIEQNKLTYVEEVAKLVRAGSGCGSCRMLIQELIDSKTRGDL